MAVVLLSPNSSSTGLLALCRPLLLAGRADKGEDEAEAEGNEDGRPKYNTVYNNEIYTELDEAWRMIEADSNIFFVSFLVALINSAFLVHRGFVVIILQTVYQRKRYYS